MWRSRECVTWKIVWVSNLKGGGGALTGMYITSTAPRTQALPGNMCFDDITGRHPPV